VVLEKAILDFFANQNFVIVSTIDAKDGIHCSAKGIAGIDSDGRILIADLYLRQTFKNIRNNPRVSLTAINERTFTGFTLQGRAQIISRDAIPPHLAESWEERIVKRMSQRVMQGVRAKTRSGAHFEASLPPQPQYVMAVEIENVINLSPPSARKNHHE